MLYSARRHDARTINRTVALGSSIPTTTTWMEEEQEDGVRVEIKHSPVDRLLCSEVVFVRNGSPVKRSFCSRSKWAACNRVQDRLWTADTGRLEYDVLMCREWMIDVANEEKVATILPSMILARLCSTGQFVSRQKVHRGKGVLQLFFHIGIVLDFTFTRHRSKRATRFVRQNSEKVPEMRRQIPQ